MSSPRSPKAALTCASAAASACATRAVSAASTGKRSLGLSMRGQSNLGKYWCFRGSAVLVIESV